MKTTSSKQVISTIGGNYNASNNKNYKHNVNNRTTNNANDYLASNEDLMYGDNGLDLDGAGGADPKLKQQKQRQNIYKVSSKNETVIVALHPEENSAVDDDDQDDPNDPPVRDDVDEGRFLFPPNPFSQNSDGKLKKGVKPESLIDGSDDVSSNLQQSGGHKAAMTAAAQQHLDRHQSPTNHSNSTSSKKAKFVHKNPIQQPPQQERRNSILHHDSSSRQQQQNDDEITVGSTIKTTSSASVATMSRRLSDAIFRRPVTRSFFFIWAVIMVYVATSLIICVISVSKFIYFYDKTADLMLSSFDFSVATLMSVVVERGPVPWLTSTREQQKDWSLERNHSGRERFFATIDGPSEKKHTTLGRAYPEGERLLYHPVCLPELLDPSSSFYSQCDHRSKYATYTRQGLMQEGLVRAVIAFSDNIDQHIYTQIRLPGTIIYPANQKSWFRFDALFNDLEPGMIALRNVLADYALKQVERDTLTQLFLLGGGIFAGILMGCLMEVVLRKQMLSFRDTMLLLRLLPSRLTDDYRVVEIVLHIQDDDDEIDHPSTLNNCEKERKKNVGSSR
eukprot:GDKJ01004145.1.p1 GENE.GDKJ01004145.1~~GDKJ01004145.1.p1  ORF type:complete len:600 (-),score=165.84 GDKJ01004145.1:1372-3060(-)